MKRMIKWTALTVCSMILLPIVIFGPNRLYGLLVGSEVCEGTIVAIQPTGNSDTAAPKSYLVELRMDDQQVQMFSSSDQKWSLVDNGERVRTQLYANPPWSTKNGRWQDGMLMGVYRTPQQSALMAKRSQGSRTKSRPITNNSSVAASFMLLGLFVRSLKKRRFST